MSGFLDSIREVIGNGWNPDVPTQGVRPDYGLGTAQFRPMQKSQYEPTLESGETRSPQDLQSMLAGVIEAAGMAALPGVGPRQMKKRPPASTRLNLNHPYSSRQKLGFLQDEVNTAYKHRAEDARIEEGLSNLRLPSLKDQRDIEFIRKGLGY